jgi:hypothetical protein
MHGEVRALTGRVIAGASLGKTSFAVWRAAELGFGAALSRRVDVIATYRPEQLDYNASTGVYLLHSLVLDGHYLLSPQMEVGGSAVGTFGADRDALAALVTFVWRPLP